MLHFCLGRWITRIMLTSLILISSFLIPQQARAAVTPFGSLRFPQPTATINVSGPAATLTAWNTAIKAWNKTGVFTFTKVTGKAQIKADSWSNLTTDKNVAGLTQLSSNNGVTIDSAVTGINTAVLKFYRYSKSSWAIVAEHELGHVIGLQHNPSKNSVMYFQNRYVGIQAVDTQSVREHYRTPLPLGPTRTLAAQATGFRTTICGLGEFGWPPHFVLMHRTFVPWTASSIFMTE